MLDTEITPELVPAGVHQEIQGSEAKVGPYVLQDFLLFQVLRYGLRPSKAAWSHGMPERRQRVSYWQLESPSGKR